jgi:hypothetical protein
MWLVDMECSNLPRQAVRLAQFYNWINCISALQEL